MSILNHAKEALDKELGGHWSARHKAGRTAPVGWESFEYFHANFDLDYAKDLQARLKAIGVEVEISDQKRPQVSIHLSRQDFEAIKEHTRDREHAAKKIRWHIEEELKIPHPPEKDGHGP